MMNSSKNMPQIRLYEFPSYCLGKGSIKKNQQNLRHLSKRVGGVRILSKQKFYLKLWQGGGVKTLYVKMFSSLIYPFSTYFQCFFMVFIRICSILVKLSIIRLPFSSNCADSFSRTFKHLLKNVTNFFRGGGGKIFCILSQFFMSQLPQGRVGSVLIW